VAIVELSKMTKSLLTNELLFGEKVTLSIALINDKQLLHRSIHKFIKINASTKIAILLSSLLANSVLQLLDMSILLSLHFVIRRISLWNIYFIDN